MCLDAVSFNVEMFKYVPNKFKTEKMCLDAVSFNAEMFEYVPESMKTKEFWELVFNKLISEIAYIMKNNGDLY